MVDYAILQPLYSKYLDNSNDQVCVYKIEDKFHLVKTDYQPGSWYYDEEAEVEYELIRIVHTLQKAFGWFTNYK